MTRRLVSLLLAALFAAFAAYGSFVPLRFRSVGFAEAVQQFAATPLVPLGRASRSDFITNVTIGVTPSLTTRERRNAAKARTYGVEARASQAWGRWRGELAW